MLKNKNFLHCGVHHTSSRKDVSHTIYNNQTKQMQTSCWHTEFVIVFIKNGIFVVAGTLSYVSYTTVRYGTDQTALKISTRSITGIFSRIQNNHRNGYAISAIRVPTLTSKKIQDFSRTPRTFFQDVVAAQQYLNAKTNGSYLLRIYNVEVQ